MPEAKTSQLAMVAPVFQVSGLTAALDHYRDKLLFEVRFEWADREGEASRYAIICRDKVELHLAAGDEPAPSTAYCFVDGIDGYHAQVNAAGANITEEITDKPWDMREFGTADPDGNILYFGEHLDRIKD